MKDFLWGAATASYQCEGAYNLDERVESMWDRYLHEGNYENGDVASDHYHFFKEDIRMMKEGGQNAYRFSLSWPRIIKNEQGEINPKGIKFYNDLLDCCIENGITPFVTVYHWDLPQFLEDKGGWLNRDTCYSYQHYIKVCFDAFKDKVRHWVTFNEPKWFTANGYLIGNYPPGVTNPQMMIKAAYHVMLSSAMGVKIFKEGNYKGQIGIVHSFGPVNGVDDSLETRIAMRYADNFCNNWVLDTAAKGEIPIDLLAELHKKYDLSFIKTEDLRLIKENTVDFLGLNYYARTLVKPYTGGETCLVLNNSGSKGKGTSKILIKDWYEQVLNDPNSRYTEWDTEIYPQGLYEGLLEIKRRYNLPVYITENGLGMYEDVSVDQVQDDYRIEFMKEHIDAILKAKEEGVDVRGYFAWSSFDLYSWKNGVEKRYGLVAVDYDNNLKRKPKKSYYWYRDFIKNFK